MPVYTSFTQQTQTICITFIQCWTNVEDVGPTLYKCYTHVFCLLCSYQRQYAVVQKQPAVLRKYTVTAVCRIVIAVCALIKTMICFSSERSHSANVGLLLGQCNKRQDNIKYTLWSAWRFCEWWRRTQSCWCHHRMWWCSRSSTVYCRLVTAVYHWKYVW